MRGSYGNCLEVVKNGWNGNYNCQYSKKEGREPPVCSYRVIK